MPLTSLARFERPRSVNGSGTRSTSNRSGSPPAAERAIGHVLVPLRVDDAERESIALALRMAAAHRARVTFLHVLAPVEATSTHWLDAIGNLHRALDGQPRDAVAAIRMRETEIRAFVERASPTALRGAVPIDVEFRIGDVATEITRAMRELAVDLVVLCRRPKRRRPSLLPGLTDRVVRRSAVPIVIA